MWETYRDVIVEPSARNHLRRNYFFLHFCVHVEGSGDVNRTLKLKTLKKTKVFLISFILCLHTLVYLSFWEKTAVDGVTGAGLVSMERLSWDVADWLMAAAKNQ